MVLRTILKIILLGAWTLSFVARAQAAPLKPDAAPVLLDGSALLMIRASIGSFSPEDRASAISNKLAKLSKDPFFKPDSIVISPGDNSVDLQAGDRVLMSVTHSDAKLENMPQEDLANRDLGILKQALESHRERYGPKALMVESVKALLMTLVLAGLWMILGWAQRKSLSWIDGSKDHLIPRLGIQKMELLSARQTADFLKTLVRLLRFAASLFLLYAFLSLVLSFFPWTQGFSEKLFGYFWAPLSGMGTALVRYLPNLIFIVVVVLVVRYALKLIRLIFDGIAHGRIVLEGFYADWADPTYQIVRVGVIAFTAVILFPYLPGSDSIAFKGISVFFGLLLSLGSGSAVANGVAGIILTYMRPFQVGDRVMIGETVGDVKEKTLLVTRVHTIKNEVVTIPNSMVLGSHLINYSSTAHEEGLILHTSVTIGYDVPWRRVHSLLIAAAQATENILKQPAPFVLQTALGDFNVSYELNASTDKPSQMASTYSALHQAIQDQFNQAGVEIMSPHYAALRDGNRSTVPGENLPENYSAPGFRMSEIRTSEQKKPGAST